ncbi:hypothetical protein HRO26_03450 [Treponema pectinovorum]|uniref:hypothetical protein n=1 Tax=Treponema pectinovorum TaxID=164 RepID=UPI003D8C0CB8
MKKNLFLKLSTLTLIILALSFFNSCTKNKNISSPIQKNEEYLSQTLKTGVKLKKLDEQTKSFLSEKTIAIILGHSYNDESTIENFLQLLNLNYGLKTKREGLIKVLIYPRDFIVAGKERISSLYNSLEDENLAGIITFGAPEGLCNALARLEDKNQIDGRKRLYPVFAFFQQDDTLGSESTADFVLDYIPKTEDLDLENTAEIPNFDSATLLINAVDAMIELKGSLPQEKTLLQFVQKIVGKQKTIHRYNDYETGLKSVNHFIFE